MNILRYSSLCAVGLFCIALTSMSASAQNAVPRCSPSDNAAAERLFGEGRQASDEERWADARGKFSESYAVSCAPAALFNLALAYRGVGQHRNARDVFDAFLRQTEGNADMEELHPEAERLRDMSSLRVGTLELTGFEQEATYRVRLDGQVLEIPSVETFEIETDAGEHALIAEREGFQPYIWEGILAAQDRQLIEIAMEPLEIAQSVFETAPFWIITTVVLLAGAAVAAWFIYQGAQLQPAENSDVHVILGD